MALYALWPLLATLQPRQEGERYELCPHHLLLRLAEHDHGSSSTPAGGNHDPLQCAFGLNVGDGAAAVGSPTAVIALHAPEFQSNRQLSADNFLSRPPLAAQPRGPPVSL
jgi:hypothetical protein